MKRIIAVLIIGLAVSMGAAPASAGEGNWDFGFAPYYLWAANIEGDFALGGGDGTLGGEDGILGGREGEIAIDFGDIFGELEGVFTGHFEALYKGRAGLLVDVVYIDLTANYESPSLLFKLGSKTMTSEFAGYYRFGGGTHSADVLAGVRYSKIEEDLDIEGGLLRLDGSKDLTDPIIGGRYNWQMAEKWRLNLYGDIGGFGAGSDFTWAAMGRVDFQVWKYASIAAGYRALGIEFEEGEGPKKFDLNLLVHGPIIGINFHW